MHRCEHCAAWTAIAGMFQSGKLAQAILEARRQVRDKAYKDCPEANHALCMLLPRIAEATNPFISVDGVDWDALDRHLEEAATAEGK